jgi:hypothetical protein
VAERLFISEATVKTHLLHIYAKLGVNDRAARWAPPSRGDCSPPATGPGTSANRAVPTPI